MWVDVSSYSRDDVIRVPKSFECNIQGTLRIVVTRHRHFDDDAWVMTAHNVGLSEPRALKSKDLKEAQGEALALVRGRVEGWLVCLRSMT